MLEKLETDIKNWIGSIAGVVDFKALDETNMVNFANTGIVVEKMPKQKNGISVTIGLIILINLNAKNLVEEIYQILTYKLKSENIKLSKLCVFIKGISNEKN
ncbi:MULTISPECIES: hypothetical protein [unclassified Mycoplasma]